MTDQSVINFMARPRAEPAEDRRRRILNAARAVLSREDSTRLRLEDVAKQAGIAKGTLYLYFKDKDALIAAALADMSLELERRILRSVSSDPLQSLRAVAQEYLAYMDENHDFMLQLTRREPLLRRDRASASLREGVLAHVEGLSERLAYAVKKGLLRPHDTRLGALHFFSLLRLFMIHKLLPGSERGSLKAQADELLALFLHGLSAEAAR